MRSTSNDRFGEPLTVAGLFAGIGGIELGLHQAGHQSKLLCEIEPSARRVLEARFPSARICNDVTSLKRLPDVDVVAAGFPCQDLSQAGRTAGIGGKNSGLVGHVFRLLDGCKRGRPRWLLLENVSFMLQLDAGRGMRYLIDELEKRRFRWAYRIIDTNAFGLPQRRQRVILLASLTEDPRRVLFADNAEPIKRGFSRELWCGFYWTEGLRGLGWAVDAVPTLKGGSTIGIPSPPAVWIPGSGRIGTPRIRDAERLQGFDADWTLAALNKRGASEDSVLRRRLNNHRWKLVGNAVSVPVAAWVGRRLARPGVFDAVPSSALIERGVAWPKAAWGESGKVYSVPVSMWPVQLHAPHLADFLQEDLKELSERAAAGFYSRALVAKLKFVDGFLDAVRDHCLSMRAKTLAPKKSVA